MISKCLLSKNICYFIKIFKMMKGMNTFENTTLLSSMMYIMYIKFLILNGFYAIILRLNYILEFDILVNLFICLNTKPQ